MKLSIGRSGVDIGDYEFEEVRAGLDRGLFLPSDYAWFDGMPQWKELPIVVRALGELIGEGQVESDVIPNNTSWRDDPPTDRQLKFLKNRLIPIPRGATKGQLSDLIASLPEPLRRLSAKQIKILTQDGMDPHKASFSKCQKRLEQLQRK